MTRAVLRYNRQISCFMTVVLVLFVIYSAFFTFIHADNITPAAVPAGDAGNSAAGAGMPSISEQLNILTLPEKEAFGFARMTQSSFRKLQSLIRFRYTAIIMHLLHIVCIVLLAYGFFHRMVKLSIRLPVVALPIGGHAPPYVRA